jgi:hypothetical protein
MRAASAVEPTRSENLTALGLARSIAGLDRRPRFGQLTLAERGHRVEQSAPIADRDDAEITQILGG